MKYLIDINIVDDHRMLVEGLRECINSTGVAHVSRIFTTISQCRQTLQERRPDVLLVDISMPDGNGIDFCKQLLADYPQMKLLVLTYHDEYSMISRMIDIGVHGYVLKSASTSQLMEAIDCVYHGGQYLSPEVQQVMNRGAATHVSMSPTEHKILTLICRGLTNAEIAERVFLGVETVSWYRKRLLAKYGVKNSVQLVALAIREGIVDTIFNE